MKKEIRGQRLEISKRKIFWLLATVYCLLSCSIPNLEAPECTEARSAVREFYSFHIGNDMKPSAENLKLREKFLSQYLFRSLLGSDPTERDYFTMTDDYPKTFRVGTCSVLQPSSKADVEVLLFWKSDTREQQRKMRVISVKENGKWVVDKVDGPIID